MAYTPNFNDPAYGWNTSSVDPRQTGGILSGQPAAPGGPLAGGWQGQLRQFLDPQYALPIAAALVGGANPQQSLAGAFGAAGQAIPDMQRRAAMNAYLKSQSGLHLTPEEQQLLQSDPELSRALIAQQLTQLTPKAPTFGKIGQNEMGVEQYGWIDPSTKTVTPVAGAAPDAASGGGNPGDLYGSLSGPDQQIVNAMIDGRQPLPSSFALAKPYWKRLIAAAHDKEQAAGNPEGFDATKWATRLQTRKEFSSGGPNSPASVMTNGNTAIQHLGELYDQVDKLGNFSGVPLANYALNVGRNVGLHSSGAAAELKSFQSIRDKYVEEATKFYRGSGGSESDIKRDIAVLDEASSPEELKAAIQSQLRLMLDKTNALQDRWRHVFNTDYPLIGAKAQQAIDRVTGAAPAGAPAVGAAPVKITSDADYDALPPDTHFIGPDGQERVKPK